MDFVNHLIKTHSKMKNRLTTIVAKWRPKSATNGLWGLLLLWSLAGCSVAAPADAYQRLLSPLSIASASATPGLPTPTPAGEGSPAAAPLLLPTPTAAAPTAAAPTAKPTNALSQGLLPTPTQAAELHTESASGDPVSLVIPTATPMPAPSAPPLTADETPRTAHVPILMYHYLSTPPPDADIYRTDLSVPPDLFAAQLDRLQAEGYTTISLYDLMADLTQGAPLPEKPVILTFDDGYRDNYENAFRLLRERGMTATFFVVTDFIDEQRPAYLTWEMAREMVAGGMAIESHGRNHVSLAGKDADYLVWQALGSLETIQHELGVRPRFVSYPAGEFDQLTIDIFQSANYWAGATTVQGATHSSDDLFRLNRVRVRNTTTPDDADCAAQMPIGDDLTRSAIFSYHPSPQLNSATLIQRGGGTGPLKPRQPGHGAQRCARSSQGAKSGRRVLEDERKPDAAFLLIPIGFGDFLSPRGQKQTRV